jgi:hypothetical protein
MRRVIPGSKSEGARATRQAVRDEVAERLQDVGVPIGGFAGDVTSVRSTMSDGLRRQVAQNEEREAREQAKLERERQARVDAFAESANRHAIAMALEAGEEFHPRMLAGQGLGHTVRELVEAVSIRQDVEDQRFEAAELEEFRKWKAARQAGAQADNSAPTQLQLEAGAQMQARAARERARRRDTLWTLGLAREQTFGMIKSAEAYKARYGESW